MRHIIFSFFIIFAFLSTYANNNNTTIYNSESLLCSNYLDPGHNERRGKDRYNIEAYLGLQPSFAIKYNFSFTDGTLTEKYYMMMGMDFDTDLFAKFGVILNPGKMNKNRSLSNPAFGWIKLWRYVMVRQGIELGYKGQFLDAEQDELLNQNYGGMTANYTIIFDGNFLFDKTTWYFFDQRTARRIRLKVDAGLFFNFNKFNQPDLGFLSGSNSATGRDYNDDLVDEFSGQPKMVNTYPVISPFLNLSIGFAF